MQRQTLTLERLGELHAVAYRAENKSERTIRWHLASIDSFCDWVNDALGEDPTLVTFTLDNTRLWINELMIRARYEDHPYMPDHVREEQLAPSTVSWYVRGLRSFATWLFDEGHTKENILARLKVPKVPDTEVDILSIDEIERILRLFNPHTEIGARDLAIFSTLLDTGMRAGELCDLRLHNLHLDQGYAIVQGKGRKERPVKLGARAIKAIRFYLAHWRQPARPKIDQVFLTVGCRLDSKDALWDGAGEPLTVNALDLIFKRIGKKTHITRIHPHLLRHTFACMYLMEHHDPFALKNLLGHTSLTMTYRYVRAVERLMVVQGSATSVLDSIALQPVRHVKPSKKRK
jgi:integrase/recombinase XerC